MGIRSSRAATDDLPILSMDEVRKHTSKEDAWLVLFGEAIDVTVWMPHHPAGEESIIQFLGQDCTEEWSMIHSPGTLEKYLHQLVKKGRIGSDSGLLSWLLKKMKLSAQGAMEDSASRETKEAQQKALDESKKAKVRWSAEHEALLPANGIFNVETLAAWNGKERPMLIGLCGIVVDVSSSDNFEPGWGYGMLWAGKDTTWAMATVSLKAYDANKFDFDIGDLSPLQFKALVGWYKHFAEKYPRRGTFSELTGPAWDFTPVEMAAEMAPASALGGGKSPLSDIKSF